MTLKSARTLLLAAIPVLLTAMPAAAETYRTCISMVGRDPDRAYESAVEWRDFGGGIRAEHCMALAMAARGELERAAELLEDIARRTVHEEDDSPNRNPEAERADIMAQAGNAWLMAGKVDQAYAVFSDALGLPNVPDAIKGEIFVDRSRSHAELENFKAALDDLNQAHALLGPRSDILAYRASAYRALGSFASARTDVTQALDLDPENYEALFERASLKLLAGNPQGAIVDWTLVKRLAPGTPAADAADANIETAKRELAEQDPLAAQPAGDRQPVRTGTVSTEKPPAATPEEEATTAGEGEVTEKEPDAPAVTIAEPKRSGRGGFSPFPTEALDPEEETADPTPRTPEDQPPAAEKKQKEKKRAPEAPLF